MNFNKYRKLKKKYDINNISLSKNSKDLNFNQLKTKKNKTLGRSYGRIVCYHKGGGVKRNYNLLNSYDINSSYVIVKSIKYDPNRSSFIGLVQFNNGSFSYMALPSRIQIGDVLSLSEDFNFSGLGDGSFLRLFDVPKGIPIYNLENVPGSGSVYSKSAGAFSKLISKDSKYAKVLLPSGKERFFDLNCLCTIGIPSNIYHNTNKKYKAGTNRLLNKRPTVRGVAMNPIDHPHGGGEGKTSGGRPSTSPWGKFTKGVPTSRNRFKKNKFILKFK